MTMFTEAALVCLMALWVVVLVLWSLTTQCYSQCTTLLHRIRCHLAIQQASHKNKALIVRLQHIENDLHKLSPTPQREYDHYISHVNPTDNFKMLRLLPGLISRRELVNRCRLFGVAEWRICASTHVHTMIVGMLLLRSICREHIKLLVTPGLAVRHKKVFDVLASIHDRLDSRWALTHESLADNKNLLLKKHRRLITKCWKRGLIIRALPFAPRFSLMP